VMSAEDMASLDADLKAAQDTLKDQKEQLKELERGKLLLENRCPTKLTFRPGSGGIYPQDLRSSANYQADPGRGWQRFMYFNPC
jgi:hypothetical protein